MTDGNKILVTCKMEHLPQARAILENSAEVTYLLFPGKDELLKTLPEYQAIVTNLRQRIDEEIIEVGKRLKVIATPSTGTDHIDIDYADSKGVEVQSLKEDYEVLKTITSTAEHAFLLMLACLRNLPSAFDDVCNGQWDSSQSRGREVDGRILGILGYGRLGEMFSRFAKGFNMKVIACDPFKTITDDWVEQVDFNELLSRPEIITIHVYLTEETRGLVGEKEFTSMRDGVYLVNTSRGAIIDERAFLAALQSGKIAGAGIDVLANELEGNIGDDPLVQYAREHDNLIITPHVGGCSYDAQEKAYQHMAKKLVAALQ